MPIRYTNKQQIFDNFILECKVRYLSSATINNYTYFSKEWISYDGTINDYILSLRDRHLSSATIKSYATTIKLIFNESIPPIHVERTVKPQYTRDDIVKLLKEPKQKTYSQYRNWAMTTFFISTGVRLNTLCNIRIKDIDLDNKICLLRKTKTHKQYYIPICDMMCFTLRKYLSIYPYGADTNSYLFVTQYGKQLCKITVERTLATYNKSRGVQVTSIHLYRHFYASQFLENNQGNVMYLKELLGHSDISTTQRYVHTSMDALKQCINPLDIVGGNRRIKIR